AREEPWAEHAADHPALRRFRLQVLIAPGKDGQLILRPGIRPVRRSLRCAIRGDGRVVAEPAVTRAVDRAGIVKRGVEARLRPEQFTDGGSAETLRPIGAKPEVTNGHPVQARL